MKIDKHENFKMQYRSEKKIDQTLHLSLHLSQDKHSDFCLRRVSIHNIFCCFLLDQKPFCSSLCFHKTMVSVT